MIREVVLPTGEFCEVGIITVADMAAAFGHNSSMLVSMAILVHRLAKIDGKELSLDFILRMPYAHAAPMFGLLNKQLEAAYKTREGIA